jgi:sugar phosphate isomerase/epimerase
VVCPVGQGNLNWQGIIKAAKNIGINMYVVEMDDCLNGPFDDAKKAMTIYRR